MECFAEKTGFGGIEEDKHSVKEISNYLDVNERRSLKLKSKKGQCSDIPYRSPKLDDASINDLRNKIKNNEIKQVPTKKTRNFQILF